MLKPCVVSGFACFVLVAATAADEPKKEDKKAVPITREKLLGKWQGPKDVPVTLEFTQKKVKVTVVTTEKGMPKSKALEWDYEITPDGIWANLHPLDAIRSLGNATLNADGTLTVLIVPVPPAIPKTLDNLTFTFVKPKDPKK